MGEAAKFSTDWWRELFKKGKPLGYGGIELRDEDKYLWVLQLQRWHSALATAVIEKYGEEGEKLVSDSYVKEAALIFKFLMDALNLKPKTVAEACGVMASFDRNSGNDAEIKNVPPDGSSAEFYCRRCQMFEAGLTTKAVCTQIAPLMGAALDMALGSPLAEKIEVTEMDIDPPKHCKIVLRTKQ